MSDTTASSLAIIEKRPHRPGCVGIFFQLFDWNRRFAKKKLFSKKLLPPARVKQATKKFGGDEKLPKLRLIADENSGGFPNAKKNETRMVDSEQKHDIRNPSLVARLMGLESMPAIIEDKLKKASSSDIEVDRGDQNLEKRGTKNEVRPQKLQKTGPFERRAVTRFGAETFQFKNVLTRSRKHHPKLPSPIKSPKNVSTRNASRLIGAATKILEPGLQARSRAKCALTYSKSIHHALIDESILEATTSAVKSLKEHSSCRNCGNLQDIVDARSYIEERPLGYSFSITHCVTPSRGSERSKPRAPDSSFEQERERVIHKTEEHFKFLAAQALDNTQPCGEPISDRMPLDRLGQIHWHLTSQSCKPQKDSASTIRSKHKNQRQNQVSPGKVPPRSKFNNLQSNTLASSTNIVNETKDFVALNRNVSGRIRSRIPTNVDSFKFDTYRKYGNRRDDSLSPVRKRRSMNSTRQSESSGFVSSFDKRQNLSCNAMTGKEMMNRTSITSRLAHLRESNRTGGSGSGKDSDVISLIYSSPMKHQRTIPAEKEKRRGPYTSTYNSPPQKKSLAAGNDGKTCIEKPFVLTGDTLGALIEQKLKELNCQEEDEMALRGNPPKRTSAIILQELISALTAESPYPHDDATVSSNGKNVSCYRAHISNTNTTTAFQAKPKTEGASVMYAHDNDHLSPGSVLEASFSNDSCFSSSLDDNSGQKLHADSLECFYNDEPQLLDPDADLLDSATSFSNGKTGEELMIDLVSHISKVLSIIELAGTRLKGIKLTHTKEVILNTELVFRNAGLRNSDGTKDFTICHFLIDELETLASVMWSNFSCFLDFDDSREGNLLKGFLFDCVVEYLESRYGQCSKSGFKRLPLCMNAEMLIWEVVEEVRRWTSLAGLIPDEMIDREMSCSLGKWTDFDIEAFETGVEVGGEILQSLVDEIVVDLCDWSPC